MRLIEAGVVTVYASCSLWCDNPVDQSATLGLSDQIDHKQGGTVTVLSSLAHLANKLSHSSQGRPVTWHWINKNPLNDINR